MKFHYITDKNMVVSEAEFGASLHFLRAVGTRPSYVTIDKKEFEGTYMTDQQMMLYFQQLKKSLHFGGKIYLEATPE